MHFYWIGAVPAMVFLGIVMMPFYYNMPSLFDLRMVIGGLLALYGVVLTIMGLFASDDAKAKAAGNNISLWAGLIILAGGAVSLAWALLRPLRADDLEQADSDRPKVE